jgi:phage-related protein
LTKTILGAKGGSVRLLDEDGDGEPDTLYIADNPNPTQAVKVWRFNYEGWGASQNGYGGPFEMGATFDDGIVADFITAGTLYGLLVKAGMIQSEDGSLNIDLDNGVFSVLSSNGNKVFDLKKRNDNLGATINLFSQDQRTRVSLDSTNSGSEIGFYSDEKMSTGIFLFSDGTSQMQADSLHTQKINGWEADWQYISEIGKYVLCKVD